MADQPRATYTPGYTLPKALLTGLGLAVLALGLAELRYPLHVVRRGEQTVGELVRIVRTAPGEAEKTIATPGAVAQDHNPRAIFWHYVEYQSADGVNHVAKLTSASSWRPIYLVGEQLRIAIDPDQPELAIPVYDLRTWVFGSVFAGLGLFMVFIFGTLLRRARRPIPLDDDPPAPSR